MRNIKARPPWQRSQAGLYWHPRDSAGRGERGPDGGGGCRSPLPAPRRRGTGGASSPSREAESKRRFCRRLRVNEARGARPRRLQRLGRALPAGSALRSISCGQPAGNLISAVAFGEKSARRPRPASGEQTKVCEARPRGRAAAGRPC